MSKVVNSLLYFLDLRKEGVRSEIVVGDLGVLPNQMLLRKDKGCGWLSSTLNWFRGIGNSVFLERSRYDDFVKMVNGEVSSIQLGDYLPYMRGALDRLDSMDIPVEVKHYDFVGLVRNVLYGIYMGIDDKYRVTNIDEYGSNDYFREKERLLRDWLSSEIQKEVRSRLLGMGYVEGSSDYVREFEVMSPSDIGQYMDRDWVSNVTIWGNYCLGSDRLRFGMDLMDGSNFMDFVTYGGCFRECKVFYDRYEPIYWNIVDVFYDVDCANGNVEDGRYVGRVQKLSGMEVISRLGHLLSGKEKERILLNGVSGGGVVGVGGVFGSGDGVGLSFLSKEDSMGVLYGHSGIDVRVEGSDGVVSKGGIGSGGVYDYMECYWVSYKRIGYLRYYDEVGIEHSEIVTEDLLKDFIRSKGIKELYEVSFRELLDGGVSGGNILAWDWAEESWQGVRVVGNGLEIYYGEPCEFQLVSDNDYRVKLPVVGKVGVSYLNRVMSHQLSYNLFLNQAEAMTRKEQIFLLFDIGFIPESLRLGDTEETMLRVLDLAKEVGIFPIDSSVRNTGGGNSFNQFSVHNMSFGSAIMERVQLANTYKQMALETLGLTPQMLSGGYVKQDGINVGQSHHYNQTEVLFNEFSDFKLRYLDVHLSIAQYCQKNDKDISILYTKSDGTRAYLKFSDEHFPLRRLGIMPVNNSEDKKRMETIRQYVLNTNTLGADIGDIFNIVYSDTGREILDYYEYAMKKREEKEAKAQESQLKQMQEQYRLEEERDVKRWERDEVSRQRDRENRLAVEEMESYGRAIDSNASMESLSYIDSQSKEALERSRIELKREELDRKYGNDEKRMANDFQMKLKELEVRLAEVAQREKDRRSKEYIAKVNKN